MTEQTTTRARRVPYQVWNLITVVVLGTLVIAEVVPVLLAHPRHLLPWLALTVIPLVVGWGLYRRARYPSWLLPRIYLLVAVPGWLMFSITDHMTSLWLGVPWLLIVPIVLSGGWVDRLLGTPDPDPSPPPRPHTRR